VRSSSSTNAASAGPGSELAVPPAGAALGEAPDPNAVVIPAGTRIALKLIQAISTKNAREGDVVYAETAIPFVVNELVLVPAGTYVQGRISRAKRGGRLMGRAELLVHFTSIIYPNGYTVMLAGGVENTPGADNKTMKDKEGTIQQDSDMGKKIEKGAKAGAVGAGVGVLAGVVYGGLSGARIGGAAGAAAGIAWALLKRNSDLKLDAGASIEMEIQRAVPLDMSRITPARATP
jgi:type IV secretion system protein VirB10